MVHTMHWCVVEWDQGRDSLMERGKGEEREHKEGERRECDQAGPQKALDSLQGRWLPSDTACQGGGIRNQPAVFPKVLEQLMRHLLLAPRSLIRRWSNPIFKARS